MKQAQKGKHRLTTELSSEHNAPGVPASNSATTALAQPSWWCRTCGWRPSSSPWSMHFAIASDDSDAVRWVILMEISWKVIHGFPAGAMICPLVPPTSWRYSPCHYSCRPPCRIPRRVLPASAAQHIDIPSNQPWQLQAVWSCPKIGDTPQHMLLNYLESSVFQPIKFMGSSREFSDQYFISSCWLILYSDKLYSIRWGTDISRKSTEF
jgi:hypothetical protein